MRTSCIMRASAALSAKASPLLGYDLGEIISELCLESGSSFCCFFLASAVSEPGGSMRTKKKRLA